MLNKLKNLIKFGKKTKHVNKRQIEVEYLGVENKKVIALVPYGIFCKPDTTDTHVLLLAQEGYEDSLFAIQTDLKNIDELDNKEIAFGIPSLKSRITFKKDDKLIMYVKNNSEINCDKKFSVTSKENLELITEQKILIKSTAETLKGLIDALIDAFNNLAKVTQSTASAHPDLGHTHPILITGVTNELATLKTRFGTLFTSS